METFATIFAGLGLFFIGVKLIGEGLKQMSSRRFRSAAARTTRSPVLSSLLGMASGAVTQSTSAITFIVVSMATAGLIEARRAVPVVIWANVGTSALVLLATLNLNVVVLMLVGTTGILYFTDMHKSVHFRQAVTALLGIGLLFLGLQMIKEGAAPLREIEIVREFVAFSAGNFFVAFLIGMLLAMVTQSSATVSVIAVSLVAIGLLEMDQTIMIVYGAGVGSGLTVWFLAASLTGLGKQLVNLQFCNKIIGAAVLVPLFFLELTAGWPMVKTLLAQFSDDPAKQVAYVYLIYQVTAAALVTLIQGPLFRLIQQATPESAEETLSRSKYIYDDALEDVETALTLVDREQHRLIDYLTASLDTIRIDTAHSANTDYATLYRAGNTLNAEVAGFLAVLLETSPPHESMEKVFRAQSRCKLLGDLQTEVYDLVRTIDQSDISSRLAILTHGMVEGLHVALLTFQDELIEPDPIGHETLLMLTSDRSDIMEQARRTVLDSGEALTKIEQTALYNATSLFEHSIWLVHRLANS